jgi:long-chain acyl-CoA synthetase
MSAIVEAFRRIERNAPARPLIYVPSAHRVITAADLAQMSTTLGAALDALQVAPGSVIGMALGNRPSAIAAFLACAERGHPYLPIDGGTATDQIADIGRRLNAAALMLASAGPVPGFHSRRTVGDVTLAIAEEPPAGPTCDASVLRLTSGTTDVPRATLTSEAALVLDSRTLMDAMGIGPDDTQVAAIPISHAYGFGNLLVPLLLQGTAIVMREAFVPQRLPDDARAVGARVFPGVPFMFDFFGQHPPQGGWPPTLTTLLSAGARLGQATVDRFRAEFGLKIHSFYGTTETGGICYDADDDAVPEGTVGRPLRSVRVSLIPHDGAPPGGGRVLVSGPGVITSYADGRDPEVFADGGFLTGDLGAFALDGRLVLSGRVSPFVNVAGRKVQPREVEQVLREIEGMLDVRVMGVADERRGELLVAFLVMRVARPSVVELRRFCATRLASFKIPRVFVFLDEIPLTSRGKTDRAALAAAARAASTGML